MTKINATISVNMLSQDQSYFSALYQMAEDYTAGNKQAYVTKVESGKCTAKVITFPNQPPSWFVSATRWTGIVPYIMGRIKEYHHSHNDFVQDGHPATLNDTDKKWVVIRKHQRPVKIIPSEIQAKYTALFQKAGIMKPTAMQNHTVFFADEQCRITRASIRTGLEKLGTSKVSAIFQSFLIFYGLADSKERATGYISMEGMNTKSHARDSGIFTKEGQFSQPAFDALKFTAQTSPDHFTTSDLDALHAISRLRYKEAGWLANLTGSLSSQTEFKGLFSLLGNEHLVVTHDKQALPAVPLTTIEEFYRTGYLTFERLAAEHATKTKQD